MHPAWLPRFGLCVRIAAVAISSLAVVFVAAWPVAGVSRASSSVTALATGSGPSISLSPSSGPVGTTVQVSGTGFKHKATVDIHFDSTLVATAVTGRKGSFSNATFPVPATAVPGNHLVTAQDTSGKAASATFVVIAVNWPKFRHDLLLTGFDPDEALLGPGNVSGLSTRWIRASGQGVESSPAVVNGHVYIGSGDGKVYSLNAATGAVMWETQTGGAVSSSPAVTSGVVYVGSGDGKVYALDPATGAVMWETQTGGAVSSSPAVANGVVYVGSGDGNLYALDAATGAVEWKGATGGIIDSSPAVASGFVYIGSADDNVYAYSLP